MGNRAGLSPVDAMRAMIPSLTDKEKREVLAALTNSTPTPCEKSGHSYSTAAVWEKWFFPPQLKMVCRKCGIVKYV